MSFKDFRDHVAEMYAEGNSCRDRMSELEEALQRTGEEHERLKAEHAAATKRLQEIVTEQNVSILMRFR